MPAASARIARRGSGIRLVGTAAALLLLLSGCAGRGQYSSRWDGRRGYDGSGDYGYDLAASRAEASSYRARAARDYPIPGPPEDPWGPYIREAATRHAIPERWIREVMRQESGGRLQSADGSLTTSGAGAMGLMQVMPRTYDMLRARYGLGDDPYEPRDNILAGAAYIREMHDRFGAPGFLAAYNAGPDRLDAYLTGGNPLPDETVNYLARIAPRLGTEVAMSGPLAVFAGGSTVASNETWRAPASYRPAPYSPAPYSTDADRAYAGGGMVAGAQYDDPADRAFDGGGLVTSTAPTGLYTGQSPQPPAPRQPPAAFAMAEPAAAPGAGPVSGSGSVLGRPSAVFVAPVQPARAFVRAPEPAPALVPVSAPGTPASGWSIQVGAFPDPATSRAAIATAQSRAGLLRSAQAAIIPVQHGPVQRGMLLYRARLLGLSADGALSACSALQREGMECLTVPPS